MQRVTIICVGKMKEKFYIDAAAEYTKRLSRHCKLEIIELPEVRLPENPSPAEIQRALEREAETIRAKIPPSSGVIAMCIEGRQQSSEELAQMLQDAANMGKSSVVFIIGGSFGLSPAVKAAADRKLSMSKMTFPHQLARIMLLEQTYRGYQILSGGKYHK